MIQHTTFLGISLRTSAHRRALVVAYYAVIFGFMLTMLIKSDGRMVSGGLLIQTFTLGALFGGIKAGGPVKSYSGTPPPEESSPVITLNLNGRLLFKRGYLLDERERAARDHAHYLAYRILLLTLALFMILLLLTLPWTLRFFSRNAATLLWALILYALSLPQSVILWTEPEPLPDGSLALVGAKP